MPRAPPPKRRASGHKGTATVAASPDPLPVGKPEADTLGGRQLELELPRSFSPLAGAEVAACHGQFKGLALANGQSRAASSAALRRRLTARGQGCLSRCACPHPT